MSRIIRIARLRGVSDSQSRLLHHIFSHHFPAPGFDVRFADAGTLAGDDWQDETFLLVWGGGESTAVRAQMGARGLAALRRYRGHFAGFCAGSYFGAEEIFFARPGQGDVLHRSGLGFYPGPATGPLLPLMPNGYTGLADCASMPEFIHRPTGRMFRAIYWGGATFDAGTLPGNAVPLGVWSDPHTGNAYITGLCLPPDPARGRGAVLLFGYHAEYFPQSLYAHLRHYRSADNAANGALMDVARRNEPALVQGYQLMMGDIITACGIDGADVRVTMPPDLTLADEGQLRPSPDGAAMPQGVQGHRRVVAGEPVPHRRCAAPDH